MSILSRIEDQKLDRHLDSFECRCNEECIESWGGCCSGCPECARYQDDDEGRDFEREAEERLERMAQRWL